MADDRWSWADLTAQQVELIEEGERTLDVDILMAFCPSTPESGMSRMPYRSLRIASLEESQVEYLKGLEEKVRAVVVAYRRSARYYGRP